MKKIISLILFIGLLSFKCWSTPAQIIIIRHGEKIDDAHPDLSPKGCERAYQLTQFFNIFKKNIVAIYAQQPTKAGASIRPIETVTPTAQNLNIKINNQFLRDDVKRLATEILNTPEYQGKTVIIAWEHSAILKFVTALGISLSSTLQQWPSSVFDQAWILNFKNNDSKRGELQIVAEHVLPTDISNDQSGIDNWGKIYPLQDNGIVIPPEIITECSAGNENLDAAMKKMIRSSLPL